MTALVQAFSRLSAGTNIETEILKALAFLCGAGLLVSVLFAYLWIGSQSRIFLTAQIRLAG
jgi:hypothetical protein